MAFQLRRMVLVNAGTNKHGPSGRITEIDPRGGAAVVGANAVGKTFTLRLIPLFFGHAVSDLVALNKGQEGIPFILPHSTSAVCFEYQRGSDRPEDLRLVVMRKQTGGGDAGEYRIFSCGFDKDLFIYEGRFLNDEETEARARARGIVSTKKLSVAEYRSVILGASKHSGSDAKKLQSYAFAHSFGPKHLPNLDKLVATMVKKGIRFDDLVAVAVGLVQDELGLETRRATQYRQHRGELERWIRNFDAASRAERLAPRVVALHDLVQALNTSEREWRELRYDIDVLIEARQADRRRTEDEIEAAENERALAAAREQEQLAGLRQSASDAGSNATRIQQDYAKAAATQKHFVDERAQHWLEAMGRLELLHNERKAHDLELRTAEADFQSAKGKHDEAVAELERDAAVSQRQIHEKMDAPRKEYDRAIAAIHSNENAARQSLRAEADDAKVRLEEQRAPLLSERAQLAVAVASPSAPAAVSEALAKVTADLLASEQDAEAARQAAQAAEGAFRSAQQAMDESESRLAQLVMRTGEAERRVEAAKAMLNAQPGTVLAALRGHGDEQWKQTVARVLDPELLFRTDLNVRAPEDGAGDTLYGWQLATEAIELPNWASDEALREAVQQARQALEDAQRAEREQRERLPALADTRKEKLDAQLAATSEVSVVGKRRETLKARRADALAEVERAKEEMRTQAQLGLERVKATLAKIEAETKAIAARYKEGEARIDGEHSAQRAAALKRRDDELEMLRQALLAIDVQKTEAIERLKEQLQAQLAKRGIDVKTIEALRKRLDSAKAQIEELERHQALVKSYQEWMQAGGHESVARRAREAEAAARESEAAAKALDLAAEVARQARAAHESRMGQFQKTVTRLDTEINKLTPLIGRFEERYYAQKHDHTDCNAQADDVRRRVEDQDRALLKARGALSRELNECEKQLTLTDSTVCDLIVGSLEGKEGERERAQALEIAYRRIPDQVVSELNNTLETILTHLAQFRNRMAMFENEVGTFNTRLQEALGEIRRFERLADLKLDIVVDFSELDFYGKLKRMDDIMRRQKNAHIVGGALKLPPADTVEALRDFIGVLGSDGLLEVDMTRHIRLQGSVMENNRVRRFRRSQELENVSSTGLTMLIQITLLVGLVQVVRRRAPVHVPWVTDEVSTFDSGNFKALLDLLKDNMIDVITASPALDKGQLGHFAHRYLFLDGGEICRYQPKGMH